MKAVTGTFLQMKLRQLLKLKILILLHGLLFLRFLELSPLGDFESLYSFDEEVAGAREASLSSLACLSVRRGCFCLDFGIGAGLQCTPSE